MKRPVHNEINKFIIQNIKNHPKDIGRIVSERFKISRPTAINYLKLLEAEGLLKSEGKTKARIYTLNKFVNYTFELEVSGSLEEDVIWREQVSQLIPGARENVRSICNYGFTEMLNNVKDHSESKNVEIQIMSDAAEIILIIKDFGIGIFTKLMRDFHLQDPRHALLELSKGKLTSDKSKHSGQGIFFTSRMFDDFSIESNGYLFCRYYAPNREDWFMDLKDNDKFHGTIVTMKIAQWATHTTSEVFNKYASELNDYGFTKTHIPLSLARYEGEQLVSRSQAKRIMARVADEFKEVILDFNGVSSIGQAFADEIFRVYKREHPNIKILPINESEEIRRMIENVLGGHVTVEPGPLILTATIEGQPITSTSSSAAIGSNTKFIYSIPDEKKSSS